MKIIWHNKAKIDLNNNISYIAKHSPQNALKVLNEIIELVESLMLFPFKFPKEPVFNKTNIRFVTKGLLK